MRAFAVSSLIRDFVAIAFAAPLLLRATPAKAEQPGVTWMGPFSFSWNNSTEPVVGELIAPMGNTKGSTSAFYGFLYGSALGGTYNGGYPTAVILLKLAD